MKLKKEKHYLQSSLSEGESEMAEEKDIIFLTALVALGVVLASGLAAFLQWMVVIPVTIVGIIFTVIIMLQQRDKAVHFSEILEKWAFIIALILFIVAFIVLYKPA
ncbi:hydrogenase [Methanobacterium alcaliphilum]|uniref:hydrogenase n=1 Tax=Methanobacterium alcaliphilum TaxID=392018 RepID=UPI00200A603E|nr:hydrogenase [Methanobacterium alcaliphilum]MCK9150735.1 hydrogenase [Methanobacterium alcaliphilum]